MLKAYQQYSEEAMNSTDNAEELSQVLCSTVLKDESTSRAAEIVMGEARS